MNSKLFHGQIVEMTSVNILKQLLKSRNTICVGMTINLRNRNFCTCEDVARQLYTSFQFC
jgi:hypothetical protein